MSDNGDMIVRESKAKGKNNLKLDPDFNTNTDQYNIFYHYVSGIFRVVSFLMFAVLLLYLVITSFNNASDFSYENFEYIIRNFALTLDENKDTDIYSIEYNPDANRSYGLFGKGLAVCGSSGISIYSATGRQICSEPLGYKDPKMISSDKFALVYDHADSDFSLYNSFSRVYSDKIDGIIRGADVANNGYFALITSSEKYNTAVELYDDSFSLINRFNKLGYIIDVEINDECLLIVSAVTSDDNAFDTELQVYNYAEQYEVFSLTAEDCFPMGCAITDIGYAVIGADRSAFYGSTGELLNTYKYVGSDLCDFSLGESSALLLFKDSGLNLKYTAVVLGADGSLKFQKYSDSTVIDAAVYNDRLFYLVDGYLICSDGINDYEYSVDSVQLYDNPVLLPFEAGKVYICTAKAAPLFLIP